MGLLLASHGLLFEGAAFTSSGERVPKVWGGTAGPGRGKCACGLLSDELESGAARRRWHTAHKADMHIGAHSTEGLS